MRIAQPWLAGFLLFGLIPASADHPAAEESRQAPAPLTTYFQDQVAQINRRPLLGIETSPDWQARRPHLQNRLLDMLGLWPLPERTPLKVQITRTVERPDFVIEMLHFQSRPGLYVTANLYRPRQVEGKLPAVLYVCGHSPVVKEGISYGNKTHYQHHAAWFAANGYLCLVLDTLQLGELPGLHHGTYREGMWWWQGRGYTPAGVEAWNGIRAIDYLVSRPDVDPERLGVTGRSGGGATSWWLGALDDRLKVVVPVAGITDLADHVVAGAMKPYEAGVIEGHCDCMYFVNTDRWDFDTLAALVAPKALQVQNTTADPIFPEPGVRRIFTQLERVYAWLNARDRLELVMEQGGHEDTEELRHAAFAFFETHLKGRKASAAEIQEPERKVPIEELKVLPPGFAPPDCKNATIHETFIPLPDLPPLPRDRAAWDRLRSETVLKLREQTFSGWPKRGGEPPFVVNKTASQSQEGLVLDRWTGEPQPGAAMTFWALRNPGAGNALRTRIEILDEPAFQRLKPLLDAGAGQTPDLTLLDQNTRDQLKANTLMLGFIAPRGIGPTAWPAAKDTHIRRRFALIGQTLDGMRVFDVLRGMTAVTPKDENTLLEVLARGNEASCWALWATIFEPRVDAITLEALPNRFRDGPAFLNAERFLEMPLALALLGPRQVSLITPDPKHWEWVQKLARSFGEPELTVTSASRSDPNPQP